MKQFNFYTGIGSRRTPKDILRYMKTFAVFLGTKGVILRSGGADGADTAFEIGCSYVNGKKEIYLPWKNFNNNKSKFYNISNEAMKIAEKFHPAWNKLSDGARKLHSRNVYQILGYDLNTPTNLVICWSDGSGGTEQALRIAKHWKIKIYNLFNNDDLYNLEQYLKFLFKEK